jgi:DNA repair protein SbcD/Mre11
MRIIHTSDWHLGRKLKGQDRTPEIEFALNELYSKAIELEVDAVLVAGDIYDAPNPSVEAEQVAFNFFGKLKQANIPAVIIAGNHDSASRLDAIAQVLRYIGVKALGKPQKADKGGVIYVDTKNGKLCVAAMPFASERKLLKYDDLWNKDDLEQRQYYKVCVQKFIKNLSDSFRDDSVNILMAHMTLEGTIRAYSEVDYYTRDNYVLSGQMLPSVAQYIALGHIHKPQQVSNAAPTYYSGSLIQVDFGEAGEDKGFYLVDVEPGRPAKPQFITIPCQKPLKVIRCNEDNIDETLEQNREHPGYLKVIVELNSPKLGLADMVRKVCPQALIVEAKYLRTEQALPELPENYKFDPIEEFQRFYLKRQGAEVPTEVLEVFTQLHQQLQQETTDALA